MRRTANYSLSPSSRRRLIRVLLARLDAYAADTRPSAGEKPENVLSRLVREGLVAPLVVRSRSDSAGRYALIDGHRRVPALRRRSLSEAGHDGKPDDSGEEA